MILSKCPLQRFVAAEMSQEPQFDLRIIGRDQRPPLLRYERLAYAAAFLGAYRNVLQIRITGTESARGSDDLVERRVNPPGLRIDQCRQCIDIRALQLGDFA